LTGKAKNHIRPPERIFIGKKVHDLRKARSLSQGELGQVLGISQSGLSEIELGRASFTAEQFIRVLKFFNVGIGHFDFSPGDPGGVIPKALAAHGATHLVEDPNLLPSENLARVDATIRETLVEAENARALAALAPVIIHHVGQLNLHKLYVQFKEFNLENRYGWLIDNVLEAIQVALKEAPPRRQRLALSKAANVLQAHRERINPNDGPPNLLHEDWLGLPAASTKTKNEIQKNRSDLSRRWNILTALQVEDFARAIRESYVPDSH
jgi:transcriptional regulator with XRE-family HTH domain